MGSGLKKPAVFWFTGLSGAGKTTLALRLFQTLLEKKYPAELLDGDVIRNKTPNIGFSKEARLQHLAKAIDQARDFEENGFWVVASFITPYHSARSLARSRITNYIEIYVETPLSICESRDPKGLYKKARTGELKNFTGISADFEPPEKSEIVIDTTNESIDQSFEKLLSEIRKVCPGIGI